MKKTFTIFSIFMLLAVGVYAQESYNRYHINETFSAEAVPTGWFAQVTNQSNADNITNPPYGANGTFAWTGGVANLTGGGGGNRGGKLTFPTPQKNSLMNLAESLDNLYWMEMDWRVNAAAVTAKNAVGLVISDSINSTNNPRSIFGIYAVSNDGVIHVWNKDIVGPFTTEENPDLITRVFNTGNQGGGFQRAGADDATTVSRNASTATSVTYSTGAIYHITAALNFVTKKVVSITITNTNDASTVTLTNLPFIDSNAEALGNIAVCDTRGTNDGNSSTNSNINVDIDNVQVYIKVLSLGRENVTVNFLDQNNAVAKAAKVYPLQEVGQLFIVDLEEKNNFTDAGYYFAYDAANTVADRLTVQSGVQNTLTLKFKKTAETVGTYVWGGDTNSTWDYLQNNFSVSSAPAIAYQPGNDVAFSRNDVAYKEVSVAGTIDLGTANIAITAPDYKLKGDGKLVGLGKITVNAPASLALNNQLDAGVTVNANEITVENVLAAKKLEFTQNNSTLKLNPADGKFSIPIETPESSTFNVGIYATLSNTDGANYYPAITGASTINFLLGVTGGLRSTAWNTAWTGTVPANSVVNVANEVEDVLPNGFGIGAANMLNTKLHLGENVRLLQNYNESGTFNDAIQIGELTGAASSYLEGGWVDGRGREWQIGSLNTDAVFDGGIRGYHKFTAATDTTPEVITSGTSAIRLTKVGTGKWTVNGVVELPNSSRWTNTAGTTYETYGSITVNAGILELSNKVRFPVDNTIAHTVTVKTGATLILKDSLTAPRSNAITLTVDTIAFFNPNNQYIGANNIDIKGTLESGIFAGTNISFYDKSTVKLKVNTFDDGDYEQVQAEGDISVIAGAVIDITVATPTANKPIPLFVSVSADPTLVCRKVLVNGVDITANTEANTAEGYIWLVDVDGLGTGELLYVSPTGLNNPNADKAISTIQYFDIIGRQVSENSKGVVIKHIIYEDGTSYNQKLFIKE